ncbi:MAG TPA: pyridoxamine 5'-phosphate oxidase family protein [Polyangia bacterium]|nr:pyridoxamine 5'-phosphate oxidase family protein [Polyangia bacterium]
MSPVKMTASDLLAFLRGYPHAVQASVTPGGAPQAAVVGVAVTDSLELVFDTLGRTRKASNLRHAPRIAFVVGGDQATVQYEGVADEPSGAELTCLKRIYFERFPERRRRESPADLTYFRTRPSWIRYTGFRGGRLEIVEWSGADLSRATPLGRAVRAAAAD